MNERAEKQPTISQTLHAVHAAADMLLTGRKIAHEYIMEEPYIPPAEEFANRIWKESGVDFFSLTGEQRKKLADNSREIYLLMHKRAEFQQRFHSNPLAFGLKVLELFEKESRGKLKLNRLNVRIAWGLFSFSLVLDKNDYLLAQNALDRSKEEKTSGWVTRVEGPLGRIPIVLDLGPSAPPEYALPLTVSHEDFHIFQESRGELLGKIDIGEKLITEERLRLINNKDVQPEDLDAALEYLDWLTEIAKRDNEIEIRAHAWSRNLAFTHEKLRGGFDLALALIHNALYAESSGLTTKQKIEISFKSRVKATEAELLPISIINYIHQFLENYQNKLNKEVHPSDWIASRLTVLPINSAPTLIKQALLGRGAEVIGETQIDHFRILAESLINHALKSVHPEFWTLFPKEISQENIEPFLKAIIKTYQDTSLYSDLLEESGVDKKDYSRLRKWILDAAVKYIPKGGKRKAKRLLMKSLQKDIIR